MNDGDPTYGQFRLFYAGSSNNRTWRTNAAGTYYFEEAAINPVPEPGTLALFGLGLLGLGVTRRKGA